MRPTASEMEGLFLLRVSLESVVALPGVQTGLVRGRPRNFGRFTRDPSKSRTITSVCSKRLPASPDDLADCRRTGAGREARRSCMAVAARGLAPRSGARARCELGYTNASRAGDLWPPWRSCSGHRSHLPGRSGGRSTAHDRPSAVAPGVLRTRSRRRFGLPSVGRFRRTDQAPKTSKVPKSACRRKPITGFAAVVLTATYFKVQQVKPVGPADCTSRAL